MAYEQKAVLTPSSQIELALVPDRNYTRRFISGGY